MIVVDSSAIIAILNSEPEAANFSGRLRSAPRCLMAAPTKVELLMVAIGRKRVEAKVVVLDLLEQYRIDVVNFTDPLAILAVEAFDRYGKGRHKAGLNFGDCMAYALAKSLDAPLLFKGGDFALTDIRPAA